MGLIVAYGYTDGSFHRLLQRRYYSNCSTPSTALAVSIRPLYWGLMACNVLIPQLLWFKGIRRNPLVLCFHLSGGQRGHVAGTFHHHRLRACRKISCPPPGTFTCPPDWDVITFVGTMGLFLTLIFLFVRVLPAISIFEMRELVHHEAHSRGTQPRQGSGPFRGSGRPGT